MAATLIRVPGFHNAQRVRFVGGEGIVRSYKPEAGTWTYSIEMALGVEPEFGRIGAETMVVLAESDLRAA
ncbi:hypothetical protein [Leptolyngbya sp. NIES-2104]|uniref:hypothetical protein n=1 Tax=Leptolyngbya sp. NIES-2104 TaxID=1552121 RepID=UPI0006EC569E|nr:hypothetical protein [Leptolyngbya sp. NIES-2104]GAP94133.1 hypothetical protein NIES2104_06430 [Leptolyngbya sp. NIES-2104]